MSDSGPSGKKAGVLSKVRDILCVAWLGAVVFSYLALVIIPKVGEKLSGR